MKRTPGRPIALLALAVCGGAATGSRAAGPPAPLNICLAPVKAEMAYGDSTEAMNAVRDSFVSFLSGPSTSVKLLQARLELQAREEAKLAGCAYTVFPRVRHERKTTGLLSRVAAGAVQSGAWEVAGSSPSTATRVIAGAASSGAANLAVASQIKTRDSLTLAYRVESADGARLLDKQARRRASSDGEDLLTPLIESASETIVSTLKSPPR